MVSKLSQFSGWAAVKGVYLNKKHLKDEYLQRIHEQIQESESRHNGEFVVAFEAVMPRHLNNPRERALEVFGRLGVWDTPDNTGVLLYLCFDKQAIEIIADRGTNVPDSEWENVCARLSENLRQHKYQQGMDEAIERVTRLLEQYCPLGEGATNKNSLPDKPVLL